MMWSHLSEREADCDRRGGRLLDPGRVPPGADGARSAPRSAVARGIAAPARSWSASPRTGRSATGPPASCIRPLYQLDGTHVVTIEGLTPAGRPEPDPAGDGRPSRLAVRILHAGVRRRDRGRLRVRKRRVDDDALRTGLAGNLCRCTGYLPILEAGLSVRPMAEPTGGCRASILRARCTTSWPRAPALRSGSRRAGGSSSARRGWKTPSRSGPGTRARSSSRAAPSWASSGTSRGSSRRSS